jgi:hypothetical protein
LTNLNSLNAIFIVEMLKNAKKIVEIHILRNLSVKNLQKRANFNEKQVFLDKKVINIQQIKCL